jgi:hypothetical protein
MSYFELKYSLYDLRYTSRSRRRRRRRRMQQQQIQTDIMTQRHTPPTIAIRIGRCFFKSKAEPAFDVPEVK